MKSPPLLACVVKADYETGSSLPASIAVAQRLAAFIKANLSVCVGVIEVLVPTIIAPTSIDHMISSENLRRRNSAKAVCNAAQNTHPKELLQQSCETVSGDLQGIMKTLLRRAKSHGIVVTETGVAADMMEFDVIQRLLFGSGRPVLVVPREFNSDISLGTILIAWDGSENAARAVWNALPLLGFSSRVVICIVKGEKKLDGNAGSTDLAKSLLGMGINVEIAELELNGKTVADVLISQVEKLSAGLVVLGAYGHSRWREFVFGGVTRNMLQFNKIPMMMSN
jgi:nucleotide-binding universal stress UspA family protein